MDSPTDAILSFILFIVSVTLHEAAHAWAAMKGGDSTAYHGGQVSLDAMPHIRREPFGMVVLPLLTVFITGWPLGFATAPYDPVWAARHPKRAGLMAAAGPAANLALLLLAALLIHIGMAADIYYPPKRIEFGHIVGCDSHLMANVGFIIGMGFCMNLVMFVFNLFPLPPLDGSGILMLFLDEETSEKFLSIVHQPAFIIVGMLIAWQIFAAVFQPIFLFAVSLLYPGVTYR